MGDLKYEINNTAFKETLLKIKCVHKNIYLLVYYTKFFKGGLQMRCNVICLVSKYLTLKIRTVYNFS